MNYEKIYADFIADRRTKETSLVASVCYTERHHIVPRSLGGSDDKSNLILLTAEDHVHAHLMLAKIHGGAQWLAVTYIVESMQSERKVPTRRMIVLAAIARQAALRNLNQWHSMFIPHVREKMIKRMRENNPMCDPIVKAASDIKRKASLQKPEARAANSARQKARYTTEEGRAEMRRRGALAKQTEKSNQKRREKLSGEKNYRARQVICLDTGVIYAALKDATRAAGVSHSKISLVCSGKRKTAGGYRWAYA